MLVRIEILTEHLKGYLFFNVNIKNFHCVIIVSKTYKERKGTMLKTHVGG